MGLQLLTRYEIEKAILKIEEIDLTQSTIEEIKNILKSLFTGYIQSTPIIPSDVRRKSVPAII